MRFSYRFNNILGSVYDKGNLSFFPDGNRLLSPCGNKIIVYDLKNGRSEALPFEIQYNISRLALSPNASILLIATDKTQLLMTSLISNTVLHRKDFKQIGDKINDLQFSPNGRYYAVCGTRQVLVYLTPGFVFKGRGRQLSAFKIHKIIQASHDETTSIAWNDTSQLLLTTSRDFSIRIYPIDRSITQMSNFISLTAHNDLIVGAFFANDKTNPLNLYSLSRNGQLFVWQSNCEELSEAHEEGLNYTKEKKKFIFEDLKETNSSTRITVYSYEPNTKLLVVGFNTGTFMLYELPDLVVIHSLQLSTKGPISSVTFNENGHWIAIGSSVGNSTKYDIENEVSTQTQLIVWEWQSESFILKQSGYSNSVTNSYECMAYSPDASLMVTGGTDGRIKVWNLFSGFCLSTFASEHKGPVTAVAFVPGKNGKVFLSSSLDGTIKAFDLTRYRCFRTLAAPSDSKPAQFICLAVDKIGSDFVAAGSHNFFEIFLWSLKTGRLVEMLSGHEGPVSSVKFSPTSNTLFSCSWDCTVRIWNLFEGPKCTREVIKLGTDALCLEVREDGQQFAVATLNGTISFFNAESGEQMGIGIEGKKDLGTARYKSDIVNDKHKYFSTISYSVDGDYIIAAGKSKYVCIYNVQEKLLIKKFEIANNLSLDGFSDFVSKRKIQEFGFNLAVIKYREENSGMAPVSLPGVTKSDYADRSITPVVAVHQICFSPTMRSFALASTEGVITYSLDKAPIFDPFELDTSITSGTFRKHLLSQDYHQALIQALKLNDRSLIEEIVECTPCNQIELLTAALPINLVEKVLLHLAKALETSAHVEFYMKWITALLSQHGTILKSQCSSEAFAATLRHLHQAISRHYHDLRKVTEHNKYILKFMPILAKHSNSDTNAQSSDEEDFLMADN